MSDNIFESFKNFSPSSRSVLIASQRYAEAMNAGLSSEHLLLALAVTPESVAYSVLKKLPVSLDQLRLVLNIKRTTSPDRGAISAELRTVLERAAFQAATVESNSIEPEHILWALTSAPKTKGYQLLIQIGADPKAIRKTLERHFFEQKQEDLSSDPLGSEIEVLGFVAPPHPLREVSHKEDLIDEEIEEQSPLEQYSINLSQLAKDNKLEPMIGRQNELERLIHVLGRKTKNNPVLIGEPGVGKTAIVEGLAQVIETGKVPKFIKGAQVISLELGTLVAGTMYRGQFEERLKKIVAEIKTEKNLILFVDEIHTLIGAGSAEGSLDAANILKPALAKGDIKLIGATTTSEYEKYIEKDVALERRLQPIKVAEPSLEETVKILEGLKPAYENFHSVKFDADLIEEAVALANRFLPERFFPDKAIDLIDEAAASVRSKVIGEDQPTPRNRYEFERKLKEIINQKDYELKRANVERAAFLRDQELKLKIKIKKLNEQKNKPLISKTVIVGAEHLRAVVSRWTGIPSPKLSLNDRTNLINLEQTLNNSIYGQKEALSKIAKVVRQAKSGLRDNSKPIGSFLFVGPTGVGKTETAKVIAEQVFGSREAISTLDMSEFIERHQVARLIGAPPGYVGHEETGLLVKSVRNKPHQVILFDEIEKAHPDIYHILLQILAEGRLTDSKGKVASFRDCLIVLTSNLGSQIWQSGGGIGFFHREDEQITSPIKKIIKDRLAPELLSRIDSKIIFKPLKKTSLEAIIKKEINLITERALQQGYEVKITPEAYQLILTSINDRNGAREIKLKVEELLTNCLAEKILSSPQIKKIKVDTKGNALIARQNRHARTKTLTTAKKNR